MENEHLIAKETVPQSAGEKKIQEYIARIQAGESKDSILKDLPPSFQAGINAGLSEIEKEDGQQEVVEKKIEKQDIEDNEKLEALKKDLGITQSGEKDSHERISDLISSVTKGRKEVVVNLYKKMFDDVDNPESRKALARGLFGDVYNRYRIADYPIDPAEEHTWEDSLHNNKVEINNKKSEWMYRGVFPKNGEETGTRGSFNVRVTPELIASLDEMIASGKIEANYKFGQPGTTASPVERHDSISIYFLKQPSDEVLQELAALVKPYVRGDNLLGRKIGDGFYMSEIGSIETSHINSFVEALNSKDKALAEAVKEYTSPQPGRGSQLKMSEAQYYAIKDVVEAFGYKIAYDKDKGFQVT
ncbi:MAG: hypothetical protein WC761_05745 [Candidatus Paceibacterota bacterium]|jgi:hypothetical protein